MAYLILALATWRLSNLLVNEDGPWQMFARLRALAGVRFNEEFQPYASTMMAGAFVCIWGMSVWIGLGMWAMWQAWPDSVMRLAGPLALSAAAIMIDKVVN